MATYSKKYPHAFFERGSWYHRTKCLKEDYSVSYGKVGGFKSDAEAEAAYKKHIEEFNRQMKAKFIKQGENTTFRDYLIYWFQSIFSERVETTTRYIAAYVIYTFLLPSIKEDIKLRLVNTEYLNDVLESASKFCNSAGNKSRELLYIAFKDAAIDRMIPSNPVPETKPYARKKPKIRVLNREQIRTLLAAAKNRNWFLEILLGLYLGLRKGEILGLKFSDFNMEERTVHIQRQMAADITIEENGMKIVDYTIVERNPKTEKSNRVLRVPTIILVELEKRRQLVEAQKARLEDAYIDEGYISCQKNGRPHGLASLNGELARICELNLLPHITVHGLRHMFATILLERGVSIAKISGMLGHSSVHTTFEFYLEVMDADEKMLQFMNKEFVQPRSDFTANTYYNYRDCIQKHIIPRIGGLRLLALNQGHLMKMYKELVKQYSAIPKRAKTIMNTSMRYALSKRLIMTNPCEGLELPKGVKKPKYHTIVVDETKTYTLEQVKLLLEASKETRIHMQMVFALLMGLRKSEINGLKYSDIDYKNRKLRIQRQLGRDIHVDEESLKPNTKTKQEIKLKTASSYRELDIPDYVFEEILEERKKYEKNRSRRQHGQWVFQDLDYICCSSYGRPRSKDYHFTHYKKLLEDVGLPHIRFHDLRHTYATLLMKNDINQKAVAAALGHSKSIITVDTYTDIQAIIADCVHELQSFIEEVHPYDHTDAEMLKNMFQEIVIVEDESVTAEDDAEQESREEAAPVIIVYDYSDVTEMDDIAEFIWRKR